MTRTAITYDDEKSSSAYEYEKILNRKIDFATAGLQPFIYRNLSKNVSPENALTIAEYVLAMKTNPDHLASIKI